MSISLLTRCLITLLLLLLLPAGLLTLPRWAS
jgi:hypothetical protein